MYKWMWRLHEITALLCSGSVEIPRKKTLAVLLRSVNRSVKCILIACTVLIFCVLHKISHNMSSECEDKHVKAIARTAEDVKTQQNALWGFTSGCVATISRHLTLYFVVVYCFHNTSGLCPSKLLAGPDESGLPGEVTSPWFRRCEHFCS